MATKSFTSLEQSCKLAEILPVETADMNWNELPSIGLFVRAFPYKHDNGATEGIFPCWSLAALLSVFPPYLFEFERGIDFNVYPNLNGKGWHCSYMPNCIENMKKDKFRLVTSGDNLVDACVAMIEKLHNLNLL